MKATLPTYTDLGIDKGLIKEMPKNEGGGDKKSKQYKESKITGAKKEPVINPPTYSEGPKGQLIGRGLIGGTKMEPPIKTIPTYAELGIAYKDAAQIKLGGLIKEMPKNEGPKGQLIGRGLIGAIKMEGPIKTIPTYAELGIDKKDAAQWQDMAKHKRATGTKLEPVAKIPTYSTYNENHA